MNDYEIRNLLRAYYAMTIVKFKERSSEVTIDRKKSFAEDVYGAQQWAWLLWSECDIKVDILKVNAMLSLSELDKVEKTIVILFNDWKKQEVMIPLVKELAEGTTSEARFAKLCKKLNSGECNICDVEIYKTMTDKQIDKLNCVYNMLDTLKAKIRQGVINWNITGIRRESIAEHVYGVQQLAWLMWIANREEIDIFRVVAMLSIHETEETLIGDITPYSGITPEEKLLMGNEAVKKLLGGLKQYVPMHSLIKEFDAEETADAFFAHLCDKLDCDLTIKSYSDGGHCAIENATLEMKTNPEIQKLISNGAKTVADVFIMADEHMYTDTIFKEVIDYVKNCNVTMF